MNILSNAIDAIEERATALNQGQGADKDSDIYRITITTQLCGTDQVAIAITDRGQGMPPANQSKIFDPFFTTKPIGEGTGLGMSISHQIITQQHNGSLTCESQLGQGTTFHIRIPACQTGSPLSNRR